MKHAIPLLFVAFLSAQTPPDTLITVSGRVLDADTNDPIRGAVITVRTINARPAFVQTDESGAFQIVNVRPTAYQFAADASGFVPHRLKPNVYNGPLPDKSGPISITLYLRRAAVIEGQVLDEGGKPIPGYIALYRNTYNHGRFMRLNTLGSTMVTASGRFRVPKIEPDDYWVYFTPENAKTSTGTLYMSTVYPDPSGVRTIHLAPGQTETIELRIRTEKGYTITGKVLAKVSPLEVRLRRVGAGDLGQLGMLGKCDNTGAFANHNIPAGVYIVEAAWSGTNEGYISRKKVTVGPKHPIVNLILQSPPVRELTARFIMESGEPAPARCCGIMLTGPSWNMQWEYEGLSMRLKNLNAGSYRIEINSQNYPVLSIRQGKINALKNEIIVPKTGTVPQLEIVLGPKKPLVTMRITNSYPVYLDLLRVTSQGFEILEPASYMAFPPNYQLGGKPAYPTPMPMTPGQYYIFAKVSSLTWPFPLWDPQFVEKYRNLATVVTILPGGDQTIALTKIITPESFNQP